MNRSQFHLLANSLLTFILISPVVYFSFSTFHNGWLKGSVLVIAFFGFGYFAHRVAPTLTGRIVEKLCDRFKVER